MLGIFSTPIASLVLGTYSFCIAGSVPYSSTLGILQLLLPLRDGNGMSLTGRDHAPFVLRHLIGDGNRCLTITVVVDTWERWIYRDLSIHDYSSLSWKNFS